MRRVMRNINSVSSINFQHRRPQQFVANTAQLLGIIVFTRPAGCYITPPHPHVIAAALPS